MHVYIISELENMYAKMDWKTFNKWSVEHLAVNHSPTAKQKTITCPIDKALFVWLTVDRNVCFVQKTASGNFISFMLIVGCTLYACIIFLFHGNKVLNSKRVGDWEARQNPFNPIQPMNLIFVLQFPNELFDHRESVCLWTLNFDVYTIVNGVCFFYCCFNS